MMRLPSKNVEDTNLTHVGLKPQLVEVLLKSFGMRLWQARPELFQQASLKEKLPLGRCVQAIDKLLNRRSPAFGLEIVRSVLSQISSY